MARKALFLIAAVASGCVMRPPAPPRPESYTLGTTKATYRAYKGATSGICEAEPRWLSEELAAVNSLLARYLSETEGEADDEWPAARLALLTDAVETLPPVVTIHEENLEELERCGFRRSGLLPQIRTRGRELIGATRARFERSKQLAAYVSAREARKQWLRDRPAEELRAKEVCEPKSRAVVLYYAWRDEAGKSRFLFCDGATMISDPTGATEFTPPSGLSKWQKKRLKQDRYIEAVFAVPPDQISAAPTLPPRPADEAEETRAATNTDG